MAAGLEARGIPAAHLTYAQVVVLLQRGGCAAACCVALERHAPALQQCVGHATELARGNYLRVGAADYY